jgi:GTPase Era involved in 16S rRNA processing
MIAERRAKTQAIGLDSFIADLMSKLDPSQSAELDKVIKEKKAKPINVAIIGQSGVGKSTTVNNLFGATERVSRIAEGTVIDNFGGYKEYVLEDGSVMRVADLPGYGRGVAEDEKYKALYINALKDCDVILLIMQANDKAIVDDQYMVECLYEWSNEGLLVNDGTYYGQDTGLAEDFSVKEEPQNEPKEEAPVDYIKQIEEICEDAMRVLEKDSEEYNKIKAIFKML